MRLHHQPPTPGQPPPSQATATEGKRERGTLHWVKRVRVVFWVIAVLFSLSPAYAEPPSIEISLTPPTYTANEEVFISGMDWPADQVVTLKITETTDPAHPVDILYANPDAQGDIDAEYIIPHHGAARTFTLRAEVPGFPDLTQELTFTTTSDPPLPIQWWPNPEPSDTPWVKADKDDYYPGDIAIITGSGWQVGEIVSLKIEETGPQNFHPSETIHALADDTGRIYAGYVIQDNDLGQNFAVTATGLTSGLTASTGFTDSTRLKALAVIGAQTPNPVTPGGIAQYGANANDSVQVDFNGNGSCTVSLSATGLPSGASATFTPSSLTGTSSTSAFSLVKITTTAGTPLGTYSFTVRAQGTGGAGNDCATADALTTTATLVVRRPTSTDVVCAPNSVAVNSPTTCTATVTDTATPPRSTPGGTVTFSLPGGDSGNFSAPTCTLGGGGNSASCSVTYTPSAAGDGTHAIGASYTPTDNVHAASSDPSPFNVTVAGVAPTTLTVAAASSNYGGTTALSATLKKTSDSTGVNGKSISFTLNGNPVGTATTNSSGVATLSSASLTGINAGTYPTGVAVSFAGDSSFGASSGSAQLTVAQATVTVTFTAQDKAYDGTNTAAVSNCAIATGKVGSDDVTCSVANGTFASSTASASPQPVSATATLGGTKASNYTVTNPVTAVAKINQAPSTTTVTCPTNVPYTGAPLTSCSATVTGAGGLNQTLTVSYTNNTTAGTATASASFAGDTNHTGSNDSKNFTIDKASSTTTVTCPASVPYDGTPQTPCTAAVTGAGGLSQTLTVSYTNNATAGTATASASFAGDANHKPSSDSKNFTISQAPATTTLTCPANVPYTGAPIEPCTATVTGAGGLNQPVPVTYTNNTDAGTATANANFAGDANHTGSSDSKNFTIDKAAPTFTDLSEPEITYGDTPTVIKGTIKAGTLIPAGGVNITINGVTKVATIHQVTDQNGSEGDFSVSFDTNLLTAGEYAITYQYEGSSNFAELTDTSKKLTVKKATPTVHVTGGTFTYDGQPHAATATATGVGGATVNGTFAFTYTPPGSSAEPADAGTYAVSVNFTSTDPNYENATGSGSLTVNKANATITVNGYTGTYDGNAHGATGSATGVGGVDLSASLHLGATFTNVPGGTAHWTFTGGANYNDAGGDVEIVINKATATITVNGYTGTYDGNAHGATGTVTGVGGVNLSASLNLGATFTDVPGGTAHWTFTGGANYNDAGGDATITINRADPVVTAVGGTFTYDGTPHAGSGSATGVKGENLAPVTVAYKDAANTLLTSAPVNAGSYQVAARYAGDQNYNPKQSAPAALTINKATPTVAVTGGTFTYDGQPHAATAAATGVGGASVGGTFAFTYTPPGNGTTPVNAGTYAVSANFTGTDPNYENATGSGSLTINKADPVVTVTGNTCTYNGTPCTGSGSATGVLGESLTPVTVAYSTTPAPGNLLTSAPVNAGSYQVAARYAGDQNYNPKQSAPAALTINKATPTVAVTGGTFTYDGQPHAATAAATGVGGASVSGTFAFTYTPPGNGTVPINAGSYAVKAGFTSSDNNYTDVADTCATCSAALTITKASATISVVGYTGVYDGTAHGASGSATGVGGASVSGTFAFTYTPPGNGTTPVNAGTYTVSANFTSTDPNYENATGSGSLTINKANATITVNGYTGTYDGNPHGVTGTATGVGGVNLSASLNLGETFTDVPGGTAHWTFTGGANYNGDGGNVAIVISKADTTTTIVSSLNPSIFGQSVIFTATVSPFELLTGTVDFKDGAIPICSAVKVVDGSASCTTSTLSTGNRNVTAYYSGNTNFKGSSAGLSQVVKSWTLQGFYQPTDMGGVWNTVKSGSTVPLKWEVFAGTTELTSTTTIKDVTQALVSCTAAPEAPVEEVVTTTGGTTLRYDATSGQFIDNWATPKNSAGKCYRVTMTTQDLSKLEAFFKLK